MRAVLQRVTNASVTVDCETVGEIGKGFLILLGVTHGDTQAEAELLARKISGLWVFSDKQDRMNLSLLDIEGEALVVSQFTLYADCKNGRRPSFTDAAQPEEADQLYQTFVNLLLQHGIRKVETGRFGADMKVSLLNDGPVTIVLDTDQLK